MTVDFEALDLVRGENKARSYNKRIDELQQQVTDLQELVADAIACVEELETPSHVGRSITLKEKFEKIKKTA
jgi:hypothetical protein